MKYFIILIFSAILLNACAGAGNIEFASLDQEPCRNEQEIDDPGAFLSETVENLTVYQQGERVYLSMDVRTLCDANISFEDPDVEGDRFLLELKSSGGGMDDCVCIKNVTTSLTNIDEGTYNFMITGPGGNQLLADETYTVEYN